MWEEQSLYLAEVTDNEGGWRVSWTAQRDDLLYDSLDEAMRTVGWVLGQGGEWVEVDPIDARRVIGEGRPPPPFYPPPVNFPPRDQPAGEQV